MTTTPSLAVARRDLEHMGDYRDVIARTIADKVLDGQDPDPIYLAMYSDARAAVADAEKVLDDALAERRVK